MRMLSQTGDERIDLGKEAVCGEIGIAAFQSADEVQILLFRQKMKNLNLPKERACVQLEFDREPMEVTLQRIDEEHCNPLKIWEEQGCPENLNRKEVQEIIEKSAMMEEKMEYQYQNKIVRLEAELGVNDVYFIKVK